MSNPVMYAIQWDGSGKPDCDSAFPTTAEAEDYMKNYVKDVNGRVVPLYTAPQSTLTDAEREAVTFFGAICYGSPEALGHAATLRGLNARTKPAEEIAVLPESKDNVD